MPKEQSPGKPSTRRYSDEEKAAAVRMVRTLRAELGTEHGTVKRVAEQLGYGVESVRLWVRQADIDDGHAPGVSTAEAARIRELQQENRELRRANEILKRARVSSGRSSTASRANSRVRRRSPRPRGRGLSARGRAHLRGGAGGPQHLGLAPAQLVSTLLLLWSGPGSAALDRLLVDRCAPPTAHDRATSGTT
jgi:transposase-like protein